MLESICVHICICCVYISSMLSTQYIDLYILEKKKLIANGCDHLNIKYVQEYAKNRLRLHFIVRRITFVIEFIIMQRKICIFFNRDKIIKKLYIHMNAYTYVYLHTMCIYVCKQPFSLFAKPQSKFGKMVYFKKCFIITT